MSALEPKPTAARKTRGAKKPKFPNGKYPTGLDMTKPRRGRRPTGVFGALIQVADALRTADGVLRDELAMRVYRATKRQREMIIQLLRTY